VCYLIGLGGLSRFLVQGPIYLKTEHVKVQYFNWYLFYFILTLLTGNCSVTQHLAAFSKTLFTKVLFFCVQNVPRLFSFLARTPPRTQLREKDTMLPQTELTGSGIHSSYSSTTYSVGMVELCDYARA